MPSGRPIQSTPITASGIAARGIYASSFLRPAATRYVSQTATHGYQVGVNSGSGNSKSSPWLTIEYAIANSISGDVIYINDGEYTAATSYSIAKTLTFVSEIPHAVVFKAASGQTRVGAISHTADIIVSFYDCVFDGYSNTQLGWRIGSSSLTSLMDARFYRCNTKDVTQFLIQSNSQKNLALTVEDCAASGTWSGSTLVTIPAHESGHIHINGFDINGTMTSASTKQVVNITSVTGNTTSRVCGVRGAIAASSATGGMNGIGTFNYDNSLIEGNSLDLTSSAAGYLYLINCNSSSRTANYGVIRYNGGNANLGGGYCAIIGQDSSGPGDNRHNHGKIYGNNFQANASAALPIHGLMIGYGTGGEIYENTVNGAAIGAIAKQQMGGDIYSNDISGFTAEALRSKGCTGTQFRLNTLTASEPAPADIININWNDATSTYSTGIEVTGNTIIVNASVDNIVNVEVDSDAAFADNTYLVNATVPADAWSYQGAGYGTLSAWKAAVEPTALP